MSNAVIGQQLRRRVDRAGARRRLDWTLAVGPVATLIVTAWGITGVGYSGDEIDTVSAVSRSVPQLIRMLGTVDAVHGLYYLLLWPVATVAGTGEFATRFPSALAMAAAAAGTAAIARRLVSRRAALWAGLTFAVLPTDLSLARTAAVSGRLYATTVSPPVLGHRELTAHRIWVVQTSPFTDPASHITSGFHLAHVWRLDSGLKVWLYTRGP